MYKFSNKTLSISKLQFLFIFLLCIDHISLKNFSKVFMKNPLNVSSSYMMLVIELSPSKAPYYFLQSSTQFNTFLLKSCGGAKIFPWEWGRCVSAWCRIQSICLNKEPWRRRSWIRLLKEFGLTLLVPCIFRWFSLHSEKCSYFSQHIFKWQKQHAK